MSIQHSRIKYHTKNEIFSYPLLQQKVRSIFMIDDYKLLACLPLKTGTTNWQRSLISLLYVKNGVTTLDPNEVDKVRAFCKMQFLLSGYYIHHISINRTFWFF